MHASLDGHLDVLQLLQEKGASVDQQDPHGKTPLLIASSKGDLAIIRVLVAHGATVDLVDEDGNGPLLIAARNDHSGEW